MKTLRQPQATKPRRLSREIRYESDYMKGPCIRYWWKMFDKALAERLAITRKDEKYTAF